MSIYCTQLKYSDQTYMYYEDHIVLLHTQTDWGYEEDVLFVQQLPTICRGRTGTVNEGYRCALEHAICDNGSTH
jgi:hypothetical protein